MGYENLSEKSKKAIRKNASKTQAKKLKNGEIKQFKIIGKSDEIDYIRETMERYKTKNKKSHVLSLHAICQRLNYLEEVNKKQENS